MRADDDDRRHEGSVADLLIGVLAGAIGTWALDRADWFLYDRESDESRRRTWAVRPEHKDPAHVIASRAGRALGFGPVPQDHPAGHAVHYGIGIAPAVAYALLRDRVPGLGAGRGLAFGFAIWVLEDEIFNPAMGFAAPPRAYPWQPHARGLVAHLVYGFVTDMALNALQKAVRR